MFFRLYPGVGGGGGGGWFEVLGGLPEIRTGEFGGAVTAIYF